MAQCLRLIKQSALCLFYTGPIIYETSSLTTKECHDLLIVQTWRNLEDRGVIPLLDLTVSGCMHFIMFATNQTLHP
jgi:hypothetical protein